MHRVERMKGRHGQDGGALGAADQIGVRRVDIAGPGDARTNQGRGQNLAHAAVCDECSGMENRGGGAGLEVDRGAHAHPIRAQRNILRLAGAGAEGPIAQDHLTGVERGGNQRVMMRYRHCDDHKTDPWVREQRSNVSERRNAERIGRRVGRRLPTGADRTQREVRQGLDCWNVRPHCPSGVERARAEHGDADFSQVPFSCSRKDLPPIT